MLDLRFTARQVQASKLLGNVLRRGLADLAKRTGWNERRARVVAALAGSDVAAALLATAVADMLFSGTTVTANGWFFVPIFLACCFGNDLYQGFAASPVERVRLRAWAVLSTSAVEIALGVLLDPHGPSEPYIAVRTLLLLVVGYYGELAARRALMKCELWAAPTLILGSADRAALICEAAERHRELGLRIVGFVPNRASANRFAVGPLPVPTISDIQAAHLENDGIEVIIVSLPCDPDIVHALATKLQGRSNIVVPGETTTSFDFYSDWRPSPRLAEARYFAGLATNGRRELIKRLVDLAIAIPAALATLPVVALLFAIVKWIDPGPALYVQSRVGRNGGMISIFKIRSMYCDAEQRLEASLATDDRMRSEWESFFKLRVDPRALPRIGSFMRRTSLDELPQLWNVIRGEMSIIGPRPLPSYHVQSFGEEFRAIRSSVMPGLTGLWQVVTRSEGGLAMQESLDLHYVQNWSPWLELYILLQTLPAVLSGRGAR